jgi:dephospho-CoA kinase
LIIGVTGMPGSGKSVTNEVARQFSIPIVSMGDIVRGEAQKLGLPLTCEVLGGIALMLRAEGQDAIAKRWGKIIRRILKEKPETKAVLVDGVRSLEEVKYFMRKFDPFSLIAVHSSPKLRFNRLLMRQRSDDYNTWEEFQRRDFREILLGIGGAVALADYIIINEGTLDELVNNSKRIMEKILNEGKKGGS